MKAAFGFSSQMTKSYYAMVSWVDANCKNFPVHVGAVGGGIQSPANKGTVPEGTNTVPSANTTASASPAALTARGDRGLS
ncbi:MAG: hypothetical protein ACYDGY_06830 [Acidimicrobiales bacterium]